MIRRFLFWMIYLSFTVTILTVATDYGFFFFYKSRLEGLNKPSSAAKTVPYVSPTTLGRIGSIYTKKRSSFVNYLPTKPKDKIRIGAFGDSFTYGDEVDENSDFPQLLSDLIAKMGIKNVEVLNFGASWHGFAQSFVMWDEVGRQFDLDYILLGPSTFLANRDTRFNHTDGTHPYYLHSRFIIKDDELQLVDIPGATLTEKFSYYYSFFPAWRVLLYDRNDPPFLAALLPQGSALGNPFYYSNQSEEAEANEIYSRLIKLIKKGGKPIVAGFYSQFEYVRKRWNDMADSQLCVTGLEHVTRFPYQAPQGHNSRTGNELLAKNYLSLLIGRPVDSILIATSDLEDGHPVIPVPSADLSSYDEIGFRLNGVETGVFTSTGGVVQRASFLKDKQAKSLIVLKQPGSVLDGAFLIGSKTLNDNAAAKLVYRSSDGDAEAGLGSVLRPVDGLGIGVVELPQFYMKSREPFIFISSGAFFTYFHREVGGGTLELFIGDHVALKGYYDAVAKAFKLRPAEEDIYLLRSNSSDDPALDRGQRSGYVYVILRSGKSSTSIPIAQWKLINEQIMPRSACPQSWTPPLAANSVEPKPNSKIDLVFSGDNYKGPPQIRIYVDGRLVESTVIGAIHKRGEKQNLTISLDELAKPKTLRIEFVNDAHNPDTGEDRNLWVEAVRINGRVLNIADAVYKIYDGTVSNTQSKMPWEGSLIFSLEIPSLEP